MFSPRRGGQVDCSALSSTTRLYPKPRESCPKRVPGKAHRLRGKIYLSVYDRPPTLTYTRESAIGPCLCVSRCFSNTCQGALPARGIRSSSPNAVFVPVRLVWQPPMYLRTPRHRVLLLLLRSVLEKCLGSLSPHEKAVSLYPSVCLYRRGD